MQDRPDKIELLDALAEFLLSEVRPAVSDPALSFRCLIAANLASIVSRELRQEDTEDESQLMRLRHLLPDVTLDASVAGSGRAGRQTAIQTLNGVLAERIRAGNLSDAQRAAIWVHLGETLREKLAVVNPGFDVSPTIE